MQARAAGHKGLDRASPRCLLRGARFGARVKSMLQHSTPSAPLDRMFQALADPARRGMVERLSRGPASVSELAQPLSMSLSAVVQHLQVLEASGLVRSEKAGRVRTCRIEPAALRAAEQWIAARRATWERRLDRLGDYLAEQDEPPRQGKKKP
jgi:DNA-binding transcriptional ArsR family regulator